MHEVADHGADGSEEPHVAEIEADHLAHRITSQALPSDAVRETGVLGTPVGQRSQGVHADGAFDGEECIRLDRGRGGVQGSQDPACGSGRGVMRVIPLLKHGGGLGCEDS